MEIPSVSNFFAHGFTSKSKISAHLDSTLKVVKIKNSNNKNIKKLQMSQQKKKQKKTKKNYQGKCLLETTIETTSTPYLQ